MIFLEYLKLGFFGGEGSGEVLLIDCLLYVVEVVHKYDCLLLQKLVLFDKPFFLFQADSGSQIYEEIALDFPALDRVSRV